MEKFLCLQEKAKMQKSIMNSEAFITSRLQDGDYRKPAVICLVLHFLFFLVLDYLPFKKSEYPAEKVTAPRVAFLTEMQSEQFIPSDLMEKAKTPPENSRRISDADTIMQGERHRNTLDRADQSGKNADVLVLRDSPEAPGSIGLSTADISQKTQNSTSQDAIIRTQDFDVKSFQPEAAHTLQAPHSPNAKPLPELPQVQIPDLASPASAKNPLHAKINDQTPQRNDSRSSFLPERSSPAPSRLSFQQQKTELEGRAPVKGASSWDAIGTTLGEYQAEIYRRVGENWHRMIRERRSLITYGRVVIQVEIFASGRIASLTTREWPERGTMLGVVSEASIRRAGPFAPFPENLRRQLGDFMQMEISFVVY